jgi:tetratricopeptide (TPR) repeat protein
MNSIPALLLIDDVILQAIITNGFWLTLFVVTATLFRKELRALFSSLGSFSIAGGHFEFKDKRATFQSYTILANILVEMLSQRDSADKLAGMISDNGGRELSRFGIRYTNELGEEADVDLLRNLVIILRRKGRFYEAIQIANVLVQRDPQDQEFLDLKGNTLMSSGVRAHMQDASKLYDELVTLYPNSRHLYFNRARAKSLLQEWEESFQNLEEAYNRGYWDKGLNVLDSKELFPLEAQEPTRFKAMRDQWTKRYEAKQSRQTRS